MAEFSPTQLDALEDALEDLELAGLPAELESDESVAGRLGDYRDLLVLSREALPLEDVPAGVLASVLAEAAGSPVAVPAARAKPESAAPWWQRLGTWIPVLAVGASAALVLVMVRGMSEPQEEAALVATAKVEANADAKTNAAKDGTKSVDGLLNSHDALQAAAESAPSRDEEGPLGRRGRLRANGMEGGVVGGVMGGAADGSAAPADASEVPLEEEEAFAAEPEASAKEDAKPSAPSAQPPRVTEKLPYDPGPADDAPAAAGKNRGKKKSAKPAPNSAPKGRGSAPTPKPKSKPSNASPGATPAPAAASRLAGADTKRRGGRCADAKPAYQALVSDPKPSIQSRALAGLGLCALQAGNEGAAASYFAKAKKIDGDVAGFIERERAAAPDQAQQSL